MNGSENHAAPSGQPPRAARSAKGLGLMSLGRRIPAKLTQRTMFWVNKASQKVLLSAREALAPLGIEPRDYVTLLLLEEAGPLSQREICESLNLDANLMVAMVDHLEQKGLVRREARRGDRRAHAVTLAPEGAAVAARASQLLDEMEAALFGPLSPEEREQLVRLLTRLHP